MRMTGVWPGLVVFRQGWARAEARPWNDDLPDASIRLVRGGSGFLETVAGRLLSEQAQAVLSSPLPDRATRLWRQAGFREHLQLDLYRHEAAGPPPHPEFEIRVFDDPPWQKAMQVDRAAFEVLWRLNELGLKEAYAAVPRSAFLAVEDSDRLVAYAVVGVSGSHGYLQRIAVHPTNQRTGLGRALVRACLRFVHAHGCRSLMLNTQPDNLPASALYESEGFVRDQRPLHILRAVP